jgi:hypothetical protein
MEYEQIIGNTRNNENIAKYKINRRQTQDMLTLPARGRICLTHLASERYLQYRPNMKDTDCTSDNKKLEKKKGSAYNQVNTVI